MKYILLKPRGFFLATLFLTLAIARADVATTSTNDAKEIVPGPNDGRVAFATAQWLAQYHYRQQPLDDALSQKFFDQYLEYLDPQRLHFTQEDLREWEPLRTKLDDLTLTDNGRADVHPAFDIFKRYYQRLEQHVNYVDELLKDQKNFDFMSDEKVLLNRKDEPFPENLEEARKIWKQRIRSEYLQEKLARIDAKKKQAADAAKAKPAEAKDAKETKESKEARDAKKPDAEYIAEKLSGRYHRMLKAFKDWDHDDVMQAYLTALGHAYDPHSDYFNASAADNFAIGMNLHLFGIGAQLASVDGYCTIDKLVPGGPAMKSGKLNEKERIVAVAQGDEGAWVDVVEMNNNKIVQMIRGEKGTKVRLAVIPPDDPGPRKEITLVRDEIKLEDSAAKAKVIDFPTEDGKTLRLGVIDLPSFYAPMDGSRPADPKSTEGGSSRFTSVDVERLLKKFNEEKVNGVILDLRRNGGGSLEEAIKLTGLFIRNGPVVQVVASNGRRLVRNDTDDGVAYDGPLVVLTSRFSASASEIVAGALQDYGRAVLVGDSSTHGKGTVQNLNPLQAIIGGSEWSATNNPGELKMTIQKFYRAGGASTQLKGVIPDVVLPSVVNQSKDIGEAALDNALPWDTTRSAKFTRLDMVDSYLEELSRRSNERVVTNQDFAYIREDIERYRKRQQEKTLSLNEQERLREKEQDDQREKARDKERLARKESLAKVHELTLKQVNQPGLPPPIQKTNSIAKAKSAGAGVGASTSTPPDDADGLDDDEKAPAIDVNLEEAERILADYIALLAKKGVAITP